MPSTAEPPYWARPADELLATLATSRDGLSTAEAAARLARDGANEAVARRDVRALRLLLRQYSSPLVLILVGGAAVSLFIGDWIDSTTILLIVAGSTLLGFAQEFRASAAVERLRGRLALLTAARRDGRLAKVPARDLVAGDVIELAAGHLVPADGVVLAARDFLVVESALTGESFPVEKQPGIAPAGAPLRERRHCVFVGSSVRSGTARVLVVRTGAHTVLGELAGRLLEPAEEAEFARGVRRFGELLMRVMVLVVIGVLVVNQALGRPVIDSLMFAVALAVGISPELLPAIVSVSLSASARRLAGEGVLVRRLEAIEDLGGMDLLCTDKTGTLTVGVMALEATLDAEGAPSADVLRLGHLNAAFETGIENPVDAALVEAGAAAGLATDRWTKIDEIPYDFVRKRLTIVIAERSEPQRHQLIAKGAFAQVLAICGTVSLGSRQLPIDAALRERLERLVQAQGEQGRRVLAVATRIVVAQPSYTIDDEHGLTLAGFLVFADPSKPEVAQTLRDLAAHGVRVKIVTGDSRHVTQHLAGEIGLDPQALLTGQAIAGMRDEALWHDAARTDLFVELEPAQKERVVRALQHAGHAVGYLGDGINDAPALRAADVGISVDSAVDVARESADVVLLRPDLQVLLRGIEDGRRSFVNTMKYISITISANFGNMISMAVATPLLPFLPLTATQILLNNLLSDLPSMALAGDRVEPAALRRAQRWDVAAVRRFMLVFGLTSSAFDLAAFALLLFVFHAGEGLFRTGWFVVSLLTELGVVVVLRTAGPAWRSRPSTSLLLATAAMLIVAVGLPYLGPTARWFGFEPLPAAMLGALIVLVLAYLLSTEAIKRRLGRQP